jgi:Tfp pilus assembly protein PilN
LFIVVIFALGFGYYMFSNVLDQRKQELADLQAQTATLEQQVAALQEYEKLAAQREDVQAIVQNIYSSRMLLSDVLDAVSLVVPENAWFQGLQLTAYDPVVAEANGGEGRPDSIEGETQL